MVVLGSKLALQESGTAGPERPVCWAASNGGPLLRVPLLLFVAVSAFSIGCMSMPSPPSITLQRSLYPGLGNLKPDQIPGAFDTPVQLEIPFSAGLAWLSEAPAVDQGLPVTMSEYHRTGVLDGALSELRRAPFSSVAILPTVVEVTGAGPRDSQLDLLRSAAARFQYDVALLLQTGVAADRA